MPAWATRLRAGAAAAALIVAVGGVAPGAFAQWPQPSDQPAVSAVNGKFSLEGGAVGTGGSSSAVGIAEGSISTPLTHALGLQIDGLASTDYGTFTGGGAAHLFWRNPAIGLVGPMAALIGGNGSRVGLYGGEAELYAGPVTFSVQAGYQDVALPPGFLAGSGGYAIGLLKLYPTPDLALSAGAGTAAGRLSAGGGFEFQPAMLGQHNVSVFASGAAGDQGFYRVTAGLRVYFGVDKPLIRRHREDDPDSFSYTTQYDSVADFPRYPINVPADPNAIPGAPPH
jgi:hypothetical protein